MQKALHKTLLAAGALACMAASAAACTSMGAGCKATADGSVLVSHTVDDWYDQRIKIVPGGKHKPGEMVDVYVDVCTDTRPELKIYKSGSIPQVPETNTYFHVGYPFMNDKQVMIGEFTWLGRDEVYNAAGMLYIANLEIFGLQRASTAREAIKVMGELAEKYGYGDWGETLIVGDKHEAWVFEICGGGAVWTPTSGLPGAHWVARRIPDDEIFVGANRSRICEVDFNDKENFMWSTNLTDLPEKMGWWKKGEPFNYSKIFDPEPYGYPHYQSRREWRAFSLLKPSEKFPVKDRYEAYPFSIKPDKKLTPRDIMLIYSDHLEGTDYDMTKDPASGAFGCPNRWQQEQADLPDDLKGQDWERPIALYRCSYSFVSQSRSWLPDPIGGVLWFGEDAPDTTVYVPVYCGVTKVPEAWSTGKRHVYDPTCAYWAFNLVNNWANLRWDAMYKEIRAKKVEYEDRFFADQPKIEAEAQKLYKQSPAKAVAYLTKYTDSVMDEVFKGWWDFAWYLIGRYQDGLQIKPDGAKFRPGYPAEYLRKVGFGAMSRRDLENAKKK